MPDVERSVDHYPGQQLLLDMTVARLLLLLFMVAGLVSRLAFLKGKVDCGINCTFVSCKRSAGISGGLSG